MEKMKLADAFRGDNTKLIGCIEALIALDADGAMVPHGIGGHARDLLSAAAVHLAALRAPEAADAGEVDPEGVRFQIQAKARGYDWTNIYPAQLSSMSKYCEVRAVEVPASLPAADAGIAAPPAASADASQRDFAKELRDEADSIYRNDNLDWLLKEAADEIDRLKAVALTPPVAGADAVRKALEEIANMPPVLLPSQLVDMFIEMRLAAKRGLAALSPDAGADGKTLNMRDAYDPTWGDDPSLAED